MHSWFGTSLYDFVAESQHSFVAFDNIRDMLQTRLEESNSKCKVEVSDLCALEKEMWKKADCLAEKCATMAIQIEERAEQQVNFSRSIMRFIWYNVKAVAWLEGLPVCKRSVLEEIIMG